MSSLDNEHTALSPENNAPENQGQESIDLEKLWRVIRKQLPWIIGLFIVALTSSYLLIRYTKDLYEASSMIQLDVQSDASVLGFRSFDDDINDLSREIELIKSKLFFSKVVETLHLDVGYFQYGDILYEERYDNNPFEVAYIIKNPDFYNTTFDLEILNKDEFTLKYTLGNQPVSHVYHFNDSIRNDNFSFFINLTKNYDPSIENKYFFRIYNEQSQIEYLSSHIAIQPQDFKAKTISIAFKDNNRYKARDIVNAIDTLYIYFTRMEKNLANQQRINFLNEQLKTTEDKLSELENYFENFTIDNRTANLDANLGKTINFMEELDSQKYILQHKIATYDKMYDGLIAHQDDFTLNPSEIAQLPPEAKQEVDRLNQLIEDRQALLGSYNKNTYAYQKKEEEIKFLRGRLVGFLEETRKSLRQNLDDLAKRRSDLEKDFVGLPSKRTEYTKTQRYYSLYEEFYLSLMKNKAEFELAQAGTVTNFKILSPATTPSSPISPNKPLIYGIGLVAALLLSFFLIGISYLLNNKISNTQQLERSTNLPVIGSIPLYRKSREFSTRLVVDKNPKSEITEAFRAIRSNLEFLHLNGKKTIISITSTVSGEGKTFIAVNLGGIISMLNNKVVLLDLDMRKPKIQKVFYDQEITHGISTILIDKHGVKECIKNTDLENLDYIPSGIPPNPSELVHSDIFDRMIEELKSIYDVIIIDTPPVGLVTDGIIAMKKADIPLYIFRADFSKKNFVKGIGKFIRAQKVKNLSLILNAIKYSGRSGYGYYQDNGYYEDENKEKKKTVSFLPSFFH